MRERGRAGLDPARGIGRFLHSQHRHSEYSQSKPLLPAQICEIMEVYFRGGVEKEDQFERNVLREGARSRSSLRFSHNL